MALHWPSFFIRLASAIVFAAIMMTGLLWNEWAFMVLISVIAGLCLEEYFRLMGKIYTDAFLPKWLRPCVIIFTELLIWMPSLLNYFMGQGDHPEMAQAKFIPGFMVIATMLMLGTTLMKKPALRAGLIAISSLLYISMPAIMLLSMRYQSLILPLALVLMIWMNDTMAYLVGSFIGRKPFSSISPKKTWEGTIGGAILTMILAITWGYYSRLYSLIDWAVLALCASIAGTAGDLFESKLKRLASLKDSGKMMPGHGGALDRFDSLLIATPFAFAYANVFMEPLHKVVF